MPSIQKDFYKILQVSPTATLQEIKTSYRKLALLLHPDRTNGDSDKIQAFRDATEAYGILSDHNLRVQYDRTFLGRRTTTPINHAHSMRRAESLKNYRKVYVSRPPPNGKWHDAHKHYEMHYGDGMMKESLRKAHNRAKTRGDFEYHSPLGKGFSFDPDLVSAWEPKSGNKTDASTTSSSQTKSGSTNNSYGTNSYMKNPYSKVVNQGPPNMVWQYEESHLYGAKNVLNRKDRVVGNLHAMRAQRLQQREEQENESSNSSSRYSGNSSSHPLKHQQQSQLHDDACIIM